VPVTKMEHKSGELLFYCSIKIVGKVGQLATNGRSCNSDVTVIQNQLVGCQGNVE
jgi:hypothetical protein